MSEGTADRPIVLLADDDETLRLTLGEALRAAAFDVDEAGDGLEVLEQFGRRRPDFIILDVMMPRLDGFEACSRLRQLPGGALVPILVATGLDDREAIDRAFEAGATDFVTKPISTAILARRVRYMLRASRTTRDLRRSERRLAAAQVMARLGHWERDLATGYETWSDEAWELLGLDRSPAPPSDEAIVGRFHPDEQETAARIIEAARHRYQSFNVDTRLLDTLGHVRFVHFRSELVAGDGDEGDRLAVSVQDITERKSTEERIRVLAYYDGLTQLPNRQYFVERVTRDILSARRSHRPMAVLFLDLDRFKRINDTLGHRVGDLLLVGVADRLRAAVRGSDEVARDESAETDSLARLGGDEFILCLRDMARREDALLVARRVLDALHEPFNLEGHEIEVTGSVGISIFPDDGEDVDALLQHADTAMYRSKAERVGGIRFYNPEMSARALRRLSMESALRRALETNHFELHYQVQVDAFSGKIVGLEALIRWDHEVLGLVSPTEFIPLAEECGLVAAIGRWGIREACETMARWRRNGLPAIPVAVNISAPHVQQGPLVEEVAAALAATGLGAESLEIEITESALIDHRDETIEKLRRLREMGVSIAIDDFGTGFSNLGYLKSLPVSRLKIDRSFVRGVAERGPDAAIVSAIVTMARGLGLSVVGEGVEHEAQRAALAALGCPTLQGYLFGRPVRADEIEQALREPATDPLHLGAGRG